MNYQFYIFRVVKSPEGRLFYGIDAGCSCPSPFEGFRAEADWTPITDTPDSVESFKRELFSWVKESESATMQDCVALVDKVTAILEGKCPSKAS